MSNENNIVKLSYREKVSIATMKEIISVCLQEKLSGVQYEVNLMVLFNSIEYIVLIIFYLP